MNFPFAFPELFNDQEVLEKVAHVEITRASRLKYPLALAVIDIDHFQEVIDSHGHDAGEQVLIACQKFCNTNIREIDTLIHAGGDEFVLFLPGASCEHAYVVIERIRELISRMKITVNGENLTVTISSGIVNLSDHQDTLETLLDKANQALQFAKSAGRNRVVGFDDL